jgi:hypothetical protein
MSSKKESWKAIMIDGRKPTVPYMISNHGRLGVLNDGKIEVRVFKPTAGSYRYNVRQNGKNKALFVAREVAKAFLKKPSAKHKFVVHLDHNYLNNHQDNLRWATAAEHKAHTINSPRSVEAREKLAISGGSRSKVMSEKQVTALKKMMWDPKRKMTLKKLAEKFGVSEMQVYRIKKGEFWYHIRVENEPLHAKYKQNLANLEYQRKKALKATGRKK